MNLRRSMLAAVVLLFPTLTFAASKEIQELQRDVADLQERMRTMQRSQDEAFATLRTLVQQAIDTSSKANTSVALLENSLRQILQGQEKSLVVPVATLSTKIDQVSNDVAVLRDSVSDVSSRLGKLQQQITDINNAVRTIQAPAPPPGSAPPASGGPAAASIPAAEALYANARRDMLGGKPDLALQEFNDYLKYYGNMDTAPNAQFYIGYIQYSQTDYDDALHSFDAVLEKYPDNDKTQDALLYKGLTLVKLKQPTKGSQEFRELIKRYPGTDAANRACSQLKQLGLSCGPSRAAAKPARSRKR